MIQPHLTCDFNMQNIMLAPGVQFVDEYDLDNSSDLQKHVDSLIHWCAKLFRRKDEVAEKGDPEGIIYKDILVELNYHMDSILSILHAHAPIWGITPPHPELDLEELV
jgi:hypothetical protein